MSTKKFHFSRVARDTAANAPLTAQMSTSKNHPPCEVLKSKGWTIRSAAKQLGCHHSHVARIARGERHSARLEKKISALPINPKQD